VAGEPPALPVRLTGQCNGDAPRTRASLYAGVVVNVEENSVATTQAGCQSALPVGTPIRRPRLVVRRAIAALARLHGDSLLRNSGYNMGATVVTALLGYLYWVVAAHAYAAREVGLAAAIIAAMTLAALLANLGAGSALVGLLPARAGGRAWSLTLNTALALSLLSGLVAGGAAVVALPLLSAQLDIVPASPSYGLLFVGGVALWTVSTTLDGAFVAERAAGNLLARNGLFAALKIPLLVAPFPAALGHGAAAPGEGILASWVLASAVACALGFAQLGHLGRGYRCSLRGVAREARAMAPALAGQHLINLGGSAPMYLLPLLVTARLSAAADAYFYTAWKVGSLFFMISPAVAASLFAEGAHRPAELPGQARRAMLSIGALLGPAMLVLVPGGPVIMGLFGPDYARYGLPLLALLILSAAPDAITNVYVSVLRVRGRLRLAAGMNVGMAVVTLALAWLALPSLGIAGAGWAWLAAQVLGSIVIGAHAAGARYRRRPGPVPGERYAGV